MKPERIYSMRTLLLNLCLLGCIVPVMGRELEDLPAEEVFSLDFENGEIVRTWSEMENVTITDKAEEVIEGNYSLKVDDRGNLLGIQLEQGRYYRIDFDYKKLDMTKVAPFDVRVQATRRINKTVTSPRLVRTKIGEDEATEGHFSESFINIYPPEIDFYFSFGTQGEGLYAIDNVILSRIKTPEAPPDAPELLVPFAGQEISQVAMNWFTWEGGEYDIGWELEVADNSQFAEVKKKDVPMAIWMREAGYMFTPEIHIDGGPLADFLQTPGVKYWRVRARNEYGQWSPWSESRNFRVRRQEAVTKPPERRLSPENPLIILDRRAATYEEVHETWRSVPEGLKPYSVIRWSPEWTKGDAGWLCGESWSVEKVLPYTRTHQIPILYTSWSRRGADGPLLEYVYQNFPNVQGELLHELKDNLTIETGPSTIAKSLEVAGLYGKLVVDMEMTWPNHGFTYIGTNKELLEVIKRYSDYYVPVDKYCSEYTKYKSMSVLLGFWLGDLAQGWGVNAEDWYWEPGEGRKKVATGNIQPQIISLAGSLGATCFAVEGYNRHGEFYWQNVHFPMMKQLIENRMIPNRDEVRDKVHIAARLEYLDRYYEQFDFTTFKSIFQGTHGIRHPFETIPNTSRYYYFPIFPAYGVEEERLSGFDRIITSPKTDAASLMNSSHVRMLFNQYYPPSEYYSGEAWITRNGPKWFVLPTTEGEYRGGWSEIDDYPDAVHPMIKSPEERQESFRLNINQVNIQSVSGNLNPYQYLLAHENEEGITLHLANKQGWQSVIQLKAAGEPAVTVSPGSALTGKAWNQEEGTLTLITDHGKGSVTLYVKEQ